MDSLASKAVDNRLPKDHRIAGNLLYRSIENLVVLAQKVSAMGAAGHDRHHPAIGVFGRPLDDQLIDGEAFFSGRTIRSEGSLRTHRADWAYEGITPAATRYLRSD